MEGNILELDSGESLAGLAAMASCIVEGQVQCGALGTIKVTATRDFYRVVRYENDSCVPLAGASGVRGEIAW